jgi:hypothetical protein
LLPIYYLGAYYTEKNEKWFCGAKWFFSQKVMFFPYNPNPEKCQFARKFLATCCEVYQKRGCQVAMIIEPICQATFARRI